MLEGIIGKISSIIVKHNRHTLIPCLHGARSHQPPPSTDASISMPPRAATVTTTAGHSVLTSLQPPIPNNAQPPIPKAHAAHPMYPAIVQPPISTLLLPLMLTSSWTMQQPPYHQLTKQRPAHQMTSDILPPMLALIRQKIIQGEFIDFYVLLHKATFPVASADLSPSAQQPIKKISSFVMWMQAWNLYLSVILSHNPQKS